MDAVIIKNIGGTVTFGYGGKQLGNTNERFGPEAEANFAKFTAKFPGKTVYDMPAVGKENIIDVDTVTPEELAKVEADGLITRQASALLVLKAADCIPLIFYAPGQSILGLAHAGTSGAALHLPAKMIKQLGISPSDIRVHVGPSISQKSYRFDEDKFEKVLDASWDNYTAKEADGIHLNLFGYVIDELKKSGVPAENITVENIDTGADSAYFSHRRHKLTGEPSGRNTFGVCLQ